MNEFCLSKSFAVLYLIIVIKKNDCTDCSSLYWLINCFISSFVLHFLNFLFFNLFKLRLVPSGCELLSVFATSCASMSYCTSRVITSPTCNRLVSPGILGNRCREQISCCLCLGLQKLPPNFLSFLSSSPHMIKYLHCLCLLALASWLLYCWCVCASKHWYVKRPLINGFLSKILFFPNHLVGKVQIKFKVWIAVFLRL